MSRLDDPEFLVDENKVWFTPPEEGGYWPDGVPKQLRDVEGLEVTSLWQGFIDSANLYDTWDNDICV
ncbi:MAG: hypothetical protein ACFE8M_03250, partial [Candidatus Hermodarchaeota archaeon]